MWRKQGMKMYSILGLFSVVIGIFPDKKRDADTAWFALKQIEKKRIHLSNHGI